MGKKKRKKKATEEKRIPVWQQFGKTEQGIAAIVLLIILLAIYWTPALFDGLSPSGSVTSITAPIGSFFSFSS